MGKCAVSNKPRGLNARSGQTPRADTRPNSKKRRAANQKAAKAADVSLLRVVKKPKFLHGDDSGGERDVDTTVAQAFKESKTEMAAKKVKALNKKISQIDLLRQRQQKGEQLDSSQLEKVANLPELLEIMEALLTGERS